jgi:hypothetical protein
MPSLPAEVLTGLAGAAAFSGNLSVVEPFREGAGGFAAAAPPMLSELAPRRLDPRGRSVDSGSLVTSFVENIRVRRSFTDGFSKVFGGMS